MAVKKSNKKAETTATTAGTQTESGQQFSIQRIYITDLSFESPNTLDILKQDWKPEMSLDLKTTSKVIEGDVHEVILTVTVTVKTDKNVAFLAEVKQAGLFTITGFPADQLKHILGSFCPNVLYPYAREVVTDVVGRGGFPQLILAPVNFDALYAQHAEQGDGGSASKTEGGSVPKTEAGDADGAAAQ